MEQKYSQEHIEQRSSSQSISRAGTGITNYAYRQELHHWDQSYKVTRVSTNPIQIRPAFLQVDTAEPSATCRVNILTRDLTLPINDLSPSMVDPLREVLSTSSKSIPASYIVGLPTVVTTAPKELQGSFGNLLIPSTNLSTRLQTHLDRNRLGSSLPDFTTKSEYNRRVEECQLWESKYNELLTRFQGLQRQRILSVNTNITTTLRLQNQGLKQRIRSCQESERRIHQAFQFSINDYANKYRELALKESGLVFNRLRLDYGACER